MKNIYCFGNEFLKEDSFAKKVINNLKIEDIEFINCNNVDEVLDKKELIIIDVVKNLKDIKVFYDIKEFVLHKSISCHDLDLALFLNLNKKIGMLRKIKIIGVPTDGNVEEIREKVYSQLISKK